MVATLKCGAMRRICRMSLRITGLRPARPCRLAWLSTGSGEAWADDDGRFAESDDSLRAGTERVRGASSDTGSTDAASVLDAEVDAELDAIVARTVPRRIERNLRDGSSRSSARRGWSLSRVDSRPNCAGHASLKLLWPGHGSARHLVAEVFATNEVIGNGGKKLKPELGGRELRSDCASHERRIATLRGLDTKALIRTGDSIGYEVRKS
jgi:hypothetical protein